VKSLLFRYLLKEYLRVFLVLLLLFLFFFFVIDLFEKLPSFLREKRPFLYFLEYLFYRLPVNLSQFYPFSLSLSGLISLLLLSRTRELLALISLGFDRRELLKHYLLILLFFSLLGGIILNLITPRAYFKALYVWETKISGKKAQFLIFKETLFFEGENFLLLATPLEPKGEYLADFVLLFFRENKPERLIQAKRALYEGNFTWELEEGTLQEAKSEFKPKLFKKIKERLPLKPSTYQIVEKSVKFATLKELKQRYEYLKRVGKGREEVYAELLSRFFTLLSGFLSGLFPLTYYLKRYSPGEVSKTFLKALILFLLLSSLLIILQSLLFKAFFFSALLLFSLLIFSFFFLKRVL